MRQNYRRFFHVFIITSVCCIMMAGCGYKTKPVYVPNVDDNIETKVDKGKAVTTQKVMADNKI